MASRHAVEMTKARAAEKHASATEDLARKVDLILNHLGIVDPANLITQEEAQRIDQAAAEAAGVPVPEWRSVAVADIEDFDDETKDAIAKASISTAGDLADHIESDVPIEGLNAASRRKVKKSLAKMAQTDEGE